MLPLLSTQPLSHLITPFSSSSSSSNLPSQVEGLLTRYASSLASKSRWLEAVELYRRANRPTEAALLIGDIAEQVRERTGTATSSEEGIGIAG
jgi:hypothetical protein